MSFNHSGWLWILRNTTNNWNSNRCVLRSCHCSLSPPGNGGIVSDRTDTNGDTERTNGTTYLRSNRCANSAFRGKGRPWFLMLVVLGVEPEPWSSPPPPTPPLPFLFANPLYQCLCLIEATLSWPWIWNTTSISGTVHHMNSFCFPYSISQSLSFSFHYVFVYRFRWKCKRQQNKFTETTIPYPYGLVAAALCKDGRRTQVLVMNGYA